MQQWVTNTYKNVIVIIPIITMDFTLHCFNSRFSRALGMHYRNNHHVLSVESGTLPSTYFHFLTESSQQLCEREQYLSLFY